MAEYQSPEWHPAFEEYCETIFELREDDVDVIQARIAEWLGVSRPSVSEMIKRMEADGLVTSGGEIRLTDKGRHLAEVVVRRHRLAERFLSEVLGLPWVKVHAEAEVWEHAISDDVEQAMLAKLGKPIEAAQQYERAIQLKPDYPEAHNNLGVSLVSQGKLHEAVAQFNEALRHQSNYEDAQRNRQIVLLELEKRQREKPE